MPDERLRIHLEDAKAFIGDRSRYVAPDWLQVDLYDAQAEGPVYDDVPFYKMCRRAMNKAGSVVSFNLFGSSFEKSFSAIEEAFEKRVLVMPEIDEGNRIVLAFAGSKLNLDSETLFDRAQQLEAAWKLPCRRWAKAIRSTSYETLNAL